MPNPFTSKTAGSMGGYMPNEYSADVRDIERQRKMADILLQQSQTPMQGQMVGGVYVAPHWTQGLAKVANAAASRYAENEADQKEKDIGFRMQRDFADWAGSRPTGTPARELPPDQAGPTMAAQPATAQEKMAWALRGMSNPMAAPIAAQEYQRIANMQQLQDIIGAQGGSGAGGSGGGIAGVNPTAAALFMSGIPGADKLGTAVVEANKPVALREGDLVQRGPDGSIRSIYTQPKLEPGMLPVRDQNGNVIGAQAIPGYSQGAGDITRGKEGAKAGFDMITVQTPQGPVMMTKEQAARLAGDYAGAQPSGNFQGSPSQIASEISRIADPNERAAAWQAYQNQAGGKNPAPAPAQPGIPLKNGPQLPEAAVKEQQALLEDIGLMGGINSDMKAVNDMIASGSLKLGPVNNLLSQGRNMIAASDESSRNFASFRSTLEKMRNDSLRLNKGVQTEGDAQRAWNELVANINDPKVVQQRLQEIQRINERGSNLKRMQIDVMRRNFEAPPLDTTGFSNQPAAIGQSGGFKILQVE